MANSKLEIGICVNGAKEASSDIKNLTDGLKGVDETSKRLTSISKVFALATIAIGKTAIAAQALSGALIKNTVALNSEFELLNNKLTTLIYTSDKSSKIDPLQKYENAKSKVSALILELKSLDSELAYSSKDLSEMFASFYATSSKSLSLDEAKDAFKNIAYAASVSGADVNSLKMTLDSLGAGVINTASDFGRFASGIGLSSEKLTKAINDGNFAQVLNDAFAPFKDAAKLTAPTFDSIKNQAKNSFDEIARISSQPLFEQLKLSLDELNGYFNSSGSKLEESLGELSLVAANALKELLSPQNISNMADVLVTLVGTFNDVTKAIASLSDIVFPDWFFKKEGYGFFDGLKDAKENLTILKDDLYVIIDEIGDQINKAFGGKTNYDELKDFQSQSLRANEEIKNSLKELGGEFAGVKLDASNFKTDEISSAILMIDEKIKGLKDSLSKTKNATLASYLGEEAGKTEAVLENSINALTKYKDELKTLSLKMEVDSSVGLATNKNREFLDQIIKGYDKRAAAHESFIQKLYQSEVSLSKKLLDLEGEREKIKQKFANEEEGIKFEAQESIRKINQSQMGDFDKYLDDMKAYKELVLSAKNALSSANIDMYDEYLKKAKALSSQYQSGFESKDGALSSEVAIRDYKKRVLELSALELEGVGIKKQAQLSAHDEKMAQIKAELEATRAQISAQMEFIKESSELKKDLNGGKIDFGEDSFKNTKQRLEKIDELIQRADSKNIELNLQDGATPKLNELKTITLNGVTLEVGADTSAADFGIEKFRQSVDGQSVLIELNPQYKSAQEKIEEVKENSAKTPAKLGVDADISGAKNAIASLQKNTSSTHTVYVKKVSQNASGGMIDGFKSGGGIGFKRKKALIPGHDLSGRDDVPALLTRGEFVHNVRAVDYYGAGVMEAINKRKIPKHLFSGYANGGLIGGLARFSTGALVLNRQNASVIANVGSKDINTIYSLIAHLEGLLRKKLSLHMQERVKTLLAQAKTGASSKNQTQFMDESARVLEIWQDMNSQANFIKDKIKVVLGALNMHEESFLKNSVDTKMLEDFFNYLVSFRRARFKNRDYKTKAMSFYSFLNQDTKPLRGYNRGGIVRDFSGGGALGGYGGGDRRLALLEDGEFVINKRATSFWGKDILNGFNSLELPKFSSGGVVGFKSLKSSKDINLNFKLNQNESYGVISDEQTAAALVRYFKGVGA